ncbi:MAG: hypothetical protein ABEJ78_08710 [Haloferacaceae archaeon]
MAVAADGADLTLVLDGAERPLSREAARALRDELADALTRREEFFRTAGEYREDGSYVVARCGVESSGHRKVFDSFEGLRRLYDRLPPEFTAADVEHTGLTGGRRHMVLRHFVEHPAFDCELVNRQPLRVRKSTEASGEVTSEE